MTRLQPHSALRPSWQTFAHTYAVTLFCTLTVLLTAVVILLPLPELAGPLLVVFIPAITAVALIALTEGPGQIKRRLFSAAAWRTSLNWATLSLAVALALHKEKFHHENKANACQSIRYTKGGLVLWPGPGAVAAGGLNHSPVHARRSGHSAQHADAAAGGAVDAVCVNG
ncbi:MAG TPA: hypothetical protein PLD25_31365 [Chloroflexota bacterium]|nr:hypothetical protein [Chloroflexota bacterium]